MPLFAMTLLFLQVRQAARKKQGRTFVRPEWILAETENQARYDANFFWMSFLPVMPTMVSLT
jgi:hypothetical protein